MKKFFSALLGLLFAISLTACSSQTDKDGQKTEAASDTGTVILEQISANTTPKSEFPQRDINFPTFEEVQQQYPDKTVLVWVIEETGYERNYPFRTREVNEYLDSQGKDFAVCFYPIEALKTDKQNDFYTSYVEEMVKEGKQVDIIYSSFTYIEEAGNNAYHKYIYNGLYEPLDKYFKTETGKKLYNLMPENHWNGLRVNGSIYGIDGTMTTLSDDYGYYVNAELADKYGFDITKSIDEQIDILKKVRENEKKCDIFAIYGNKIGRAVCFSDLKEITQAVYWDEESHTAKCVLDDPTYTHGLKLIQSLMKEGLFTNISNHHSDSFFILQGNKTGGSTIYGNSEITEVSYFDKMIKAYPVFKEKTSVRNGYMATGICTASNNKDKAFELLALTQTDPYLNNLLTFGMEGTDYSLSDNRVDTIINPVSLDRFPNKMICNRYADSISSDKYKEIYDNAVIHDDTDFAFDGRGFEDVTYATSIILMNYSIPADKDFDKAATELRASLEAAGLQKVIDECNRQYKEVYLKEKVNEE